MARQIIDTTTPQPGGKMGDTAKVAFEKVNGNFEELYDAVVNIPEAIDALGEKIDSLADDDGVSKVGARLTPISEHRDVGDILSKDVMISISNAIPLSHSGDTRAMIQAALNDAATSARAGRREVVFRARGEYRVSNFLNIPAGVRLIFDGDSRMMPVSSMTSLSNGNGLRSYGALPTEVFAPTADIPFGSYRVPAGTYASLFAVGDYVWLESSDRITTSPNTLNVTKAQKAKVVAVEGTDLILDRLAEYDYPAATTTFGKPDIVTGVRVENFVWGDPTMSVRAGRGIDFRYHDDLRILDCDIGWSRATAEVGSAHDTENVNAIGLVSCSNTEIDRLRVNRVAWYGVSLTGASHNVQIKNVEAHMVRHAVSLNWNGPGEPIHVLVSDSSSSRSSFAGFDTHDVGRDVTFRKLRVTGSVTDGIQNRTSHVLYDDVSVSHCAWAGLRIYSESLAVSNQLHDIKIRNLRVEHCGSGVSSVAPYDISGFLVRNCVSHGLGTMGGLIENGEVMDSNVAFFYHHDGASSVARKPLTISNVTAHASPSQTRFLSSTQSFFGRDVRLRDVRATGYAPADIITRTTGDLYIADIDHRDCAWGTDARFGTVTLVGGTATITNNNIVVPQSSVTTRLFRSEVEVQRISSGGDPGSYTVTLSTGQIVITSSSPTDTSTLRWTIR